MNQPKVTASMPLLRIECFLLPIERGSGFETFALSRFANGVGQVSFRERVATGTPQRVRRPVEGSPSAERWEEGDGGRLFEAQFPKARTF